VPLSCVDGLTSRSYASMEGQVDVDTTWSTCSSVYGISRLWRFICISLLDIMFDSWPMLGFGCGFCLCLADSLGTLNPPGVAFGLS
jgi:hypothetical protein